MKYIIFGSLLMIGKFTQFSSLLLSLHLLGITFTIGYNDVGIRDLGLTLATFAVFLNGSDRWCLDQRKNG